ncbi:MAG: PD-(D/E)XK nuclease family protein, partial [Erysipelotrichaceae bacterium]|nr:PD-(D/E)XK nuclease family protein [Erysipelotrichaceae bacterium]
LFILYPLKETLLRISEERVLDVLYDSVTYLAEMEKNTSYVPTELEKKVEYDLVLPNGTVHFKGFIDRLDTCGNNFRIIDYKSSKHTMKKADIEAGVRLQLLTYMMIVEALEKKIPEAVLYFSFKKDNLSTDAGTVTKQNVYEPYSPEKDYDIYAKGRRLIGLKFMDSDSLDYEGKFTDTSSTVSADEQLDLLVGLYSHLIEQLKVGDIKLEPIEGACTFCTFRSICRFKGEQKKKEPILKGEDDNGLE